MFVGLKNVKQKIIDKTMKKDTPFTDINIGFLYVDSEVWCAYKIPKINNLIMGYFGNYEKIEYI